MGYKTKGNFFPAFLKIYNLFFFHVEKSSIVSKYIHNSIPFHCVFMTIIEYSNAKHKQNEWKIDKDKFYPIFPLFRTFQLCFFLFLGNLQFLPSDIQMWKIRAWFSRLENPFSCVFAICIRKQANEWNITSIISSVFCCDWLFC